MKIRKLTPMLWTEELQESITFYTEILGFACVEYNEEWQWACLQKDEAELMLAYPNRHTHYGKIGFSGSFYFETEDVQALWEQLKDTAEVVYGLEAFEWDMKEFAIKDNNGYLLQFGEHLNNE